MPKPKSDTYSKGTETFSVRLTPYQRAKLQQAADRVGWSATALMRRGALHAARLLNEADSITAVAEAQRDLVESETEYQ